MALNAEFLRNVRSQLRPGKLAAAALISAVVSVAAGFSASHQARFVPAAGLSGWGMDLLKFTVWVQALILGVGGSIACVNSIYKEKDQNTFDYQRVTRLTPFELAIGKLFGAPILMYFLLLCFLPLGIYSTVVSRQNISFVVAAYAVLLVASVTFHALALLVSLLAVRGSHTGAILLILILLWVVSFQGPGGVFQLGALGPFYAANVLTQSTWGFSESYPWQDSYWRVADVFFGHPVHHVPVLIVVDLLFVFWFLLAVTRNIKRDPNYYEIYSPVQALGFALFSNLIFLAFFKWRSMDLLYGQSFLLTLNMGLFICLGLIFLRNRDRMRRIVRGRTAAQLWLDAMWPAPLLGFGALAAGLLVVAGATWNHDPKAEWNSSFAVLRSLFFAAWLIRDMQYLQWAGLRRGKHPLVMGVLYLIVFYGCTSVFLGAFGFFTILERVPFTSFFLPTAVYQLDHAAWVMRPAIWTAAFVTQLVITGVFIWLQSQIVNEMAATPAAESSAVQATA